MDSDVQLPFGLSQARPHHARQLSLFPEQASEVWRRLDIVQSDVQRWNSLGWTRLAAESTALLQDHDVMELQFLRDWEWKMPRQASALLDLLPKPYRYDLQRLVFTVHGWLMLDSPEQLQWALLDELEIWLPEFSRRQPELIAEVFERFQLVLEEGVVP